MSPDIAKLMEPVARALLGEPSANLSAKGRLRFGTRGSVVVSLEDGTYYDHENQVGGGVLHLVERMTGQANGAAVAWIKENLGVDLESQPAHQPRRLIATYDYVALDGALMFQVCRYEPRDFRQRRPDGRGGWIWNLKAIEPVPYRLPALADADTVFIPEGEKDCDNLAALGLTATTNPGEAGKWRPGYARYLTGKNIIVLPDNDRVGREHAKAVAAGLTAVAASVKILELPGLPAKGDVSDWIAAGGTAEKLMALAAEAAALPMQEEEQRPADPIDQIVADLAELDPIKYDCRRKTEAKRLGIRASALDRAVEDARGDEPETAQGRSLAWPEPDPWPGPSPTPGLARARPLARAGCRRRAARGHCSHLPHLCRAAARIRRRPGPVGGARSRIPGQPDHAEDGHQVARETVRENDHTGGYPGPRAAPYPCQQHHRRRRIPHRRGRAADAPDRRVRHIPSPGRGVAGHPQFRAPPLR
jgi:hypothetical protein